MRDKPVVPRKCRCNFLHVIIQQRFQEQYARNSRPKEKSLQVTSDKPSEIKFREAHCAGGLQIGLQCLIHTGIEDAEVATDNCANVGFSEAIVFEEMHH